MSVKRPTLRFSVIIEDGADEQHVLLVRGYDLDSAIKQAVHRLKRATEAKFASMDAWASARRLKSLKLKHVFAGHVREVGKGNIDVTNL